MLGDDTVMCWLRRLEAGDGDAARHLWERYYRELVDLARTRLGVTPRRTSDEEDVALSVLRCLCEGAVRGQFTTLVNRHELWQLLATITGRKVIAHQRYLNKQKRGGGRVRGDSVLHADNGDGLNAGFDQLRGDDLTPEVLTITTEEYRRLMTLLDDDRLRQIAQCKLEGYTNAEIGKRLGLTCRSIERKLRRIRHIWEGEVER